MPPAGARFAFGICQQPGGEAFLMAPAVPGAGAPRAMPLVAVVDQTPWLHHLFSLLWFSHITYFRLQATDFPKHTHELSFRFQATDLVEHTQEVH